MEQHVFVFHTIPVIYAQGYKHGGNLALNRPVEIAVSMFSLKNGLEEAYFRCFVHPGELLSSHDHSSKESRKTVQFWRFPPCWKKHNYGLGEDRHGIPYSKDLVHTYEDTQTFFSEGFELNNNYYEIYEKMLQFCGYNGSNTNQLLPLFANDTAKHTDSNIVTSEACYRWLVMEAEREAENKKRKSSCHGILNRAQWYW